MMIRTELSWANEEKRRIKQYSIYFGSLISKALFHEHPNGKYISSNRIYPIE